VIVEDEHALEPSLAWPYAANAQGPYRPPVLLGRRSSDRPARIDLFSHKKKWKRSITSGGEQGRSSLPNALVITSDGGELRFTATRRSLAIVQ